MNSSNIKQPHWRYSLSAMFESSVMLWFNNLTLCSYNSNHQQTSDEYNHTTPSNITTPQTTSYTYSIVSPPLPDTVTLLPYPQTPTTCENCYKFTFLDTVLLHLNLSNHNIPSWHLWSFRDISQLPQFLWVSFTDLLHCLLSIYKLCQFSH